MIPSLRQSVWNASSASASVIADEGRPAGFLEVRELGSDAGVVETGRDGMRLLHLPEFVLQDIRARSVQDADRARAERRRVAPAFDPVPGGLDADELDLAILDERIEDPHRVGAAADAGDDGVWQCADRVEHLGAGFPPDDRLKISHHHRVRVHADDRADDVEGALDVGDPVTDRLVGRVLERARARADRANFRAKKLHAKDIRRLPRDVDLAHVDDALET